MFSQVALANSAWWKMSSSSSACVAADEHAPRIEVGAESLREPHDQLRREGLADDAAHAADAYLERVHGARPEDNRCGVIRKLKNDCKFKVSSSKFKVEAG